MDGAYLETSKRTNKSSDGIKSVEKNTAEKIQNKIGRYNNKIQVYEIT